MTWLTFKCDLIIINIFMAGWFEDGCYLVLLFLEMKKMIIVG